jgi:hypothetical protein
MMKKNYKCIEVGNLVSRLCLGTTSFKISLPHVFKLKK